MPFKSEAQRRKFAQWVEEGKMSKATFDLWNDKTPKDLPERVGHKMAAEVKPMPEVKPIKIQG